MGDFYDYDEYEEADGEVSPGRMHLSFNPILVLPFRVCSPPHPDCTRLLCRGSLRGVRRLTSLLLQVFNVAQRKTRELIPGYLSPTPSSLFPPRCLEYRGSICPSS